MTGRALVAQVDALRLPLRDESVDLAIFSPPWFALRKYDIYGSGEIGSEATPAEFLAALWAVMAEVKRVLKPTGSAFVNLGDKYVSQGGPAGKPANPWVGGGDPGRGAGMAESYRVDPVAMGVREKSLMLLPSMFAAGCTGMLAALGGPDPGLDLILRAPILLWKQNSLPESAGDRVRTSDQELMFHLVKSPRYYSAIDELREPHSPGTHPGRTRTVGNESGNGVAHRLYAGNTDGFHPLGKLPGSVWPMTSEPLDLPGYFVVQAGRLQDFIAPQRGTTRPRQGGHPGLFDPDTYLEQVAAGDGPAWRWARATGVTSSAWPRDDTALQLRVAASHYAAFPSRLPELVIRGWSPPGVCVACGQGRWPVVDRQFHGLRPVQANKSPKQDAARYALQEKNGLNSDHWQPGEYQATILGYACSCTPFTDHPGTGEPSGPHARYAEAIEAGDSYTNVGAGWGGKGGLSDRPRVGPWREYHLAGWQAPPTRPAVVLDCFGGTGTAAMVARALGRVGLSFDLSHAYCRAARWRIFTSQDAGKALTRTWSARQGLLL